MSVGVAPLACKVNLLAFAIASVSSATPLSSLAQPGSELEGPLLEEIIVTVDRREQNLQDFAGTVQAFDADDLGKLGINNDFRNLQNAVTGLHVSNQEGKFEVYLRGVGNSDSDFASDPSVAIHYNDVYLPRPRSIGPMFFDVERVEVNKGPQGTIRGRNATGGSINIISKRPDSEVLSAEATLGAGDYGQRQLEAALNIPVTETLALRAAYYQEKRDPFMSNAFEGSAELLNDLDAQGARISDAFGGEIDAPGALDDKALRLSALWEPNDQFSAYVLADKVEQGGSGTPGAFSGRALSAGFDIDDLHDPYNQFFVNEGEMESDIEGVSAKLTYHFTDFSIEYNGSWREYEFQHRNAAREWQIGMNYPGAREEAEAVILGNEQTAYGNFTQGENSETVVHEFRVYGEGTDGMAWSAGLFHMEEDFNWSSQDFNHGWWGDCDWFQADTVCGWLNGLSGENRNDDSTVESTAAYADGTFPIDDTLRLKVGVRWTEDKKKANEANANYQLVLSDAALMALGLNGPQDIIMGTNGLELTAAGDRPQNVVPIGNSAASRDYFLAGIDTWGGLDNLDDLIAWDPEHFQVVISSDFDNGDGNGNISKKYKESYLDWRFGIEYDVSEDQLLYGTVSTGTRSGGINRPLPGSNVDVDVSWDPEELIVYELGSKNTLEWRGMPVRLNGAIFYYDYQDKVLQGLVSVTQPCNSSPTGICTDSFVQNQNAANASLIGVEVDGDIVLPYGFNLRWNYAYLDSEFKSGSDVVDTRQPGGVIVNLEGNELPNTSRHNLNLVLSQAIDVEFGLVKSVDWTLSMNHRSRFYLTPYNDTGYDADGSELPMAQMAVNNHWLITGAGFDGANGNFMSDDVGDVTLWNFNAGMNLGESEQYRLEGWITNITEETYATKAFINDSVNIRFLNTPRTYGVRFKASF